MLEGHNFLKGFLMVLNYLAFYVIWIGCIYAASHHCAFLSACLVFLYLVVHLFFISSQPKKEFWLIASIIVLGAANDAFLSLSGVLQYVDASFLGTSWWMVGIWGCFGSTYWHAFSWLESRKALAAFLGALVVPLCYLWGEGEGVVLFLINPQLALGITSVLWAILLPVSFWVSQLIKKGSCTP